MGVLEGQVTISVVDSITPKNIATIDKDGLVGNAPTKEQVQSDLNELKGEVQEMIVSNFKGSITPTDPAPTEDGTYKPSVSSEDDKPTDPSSTADWGKIYPNAGNLRAKTGYDTMFYKKGTTWTKSEVKMPVASPTGSVIKDDPNSVSGGVVYDSLENLKSGQQNIIFSTSTNYIAKTSTVGQVPTLTSSTNWLLSDLIDVVATDTILRKGSAVSSSSAAAEIYCFDIDGKYLGYYNLNSTSYLVKVSDLSPGTRKIRTNSASSYSGEFSISKTGFIATEAVRNLEKITELNKLVISDDAFANSISGYLNSSGGLVLGSTSWKLTPPLPVTKDQKILYTGITSAAVYPIWGYDSKLNPVVSLSAQGTFTDKEITVPAGVDFVIASARANVGDVQRLTSTHFDQSRVDINAIAKTFVNDSFFPSKTWAKAGEAISLNLNGFVNKHPKDYSRDTFFNSPNGNEDFIRIIPTADVQIPVRQRQPNGIYTILGYVNIKVGVNANSPSSALYFMHFGDSTVKGTVNSGIEGAIVNELSRRLTGVGYNLTPATAPAALALTNINFIGTIGDQVIKHEGRGGWSFSDYLNLASKSGATNAFWNTGISGAVKFDLGYYLTQNNFTGVNSTASNLIILCQLGWNDVFTYTPTQIEAFARQWLDLIKSQKSGVRVKLISMQLPPVDIYKDYGTSTRQQSYMSTMQRVMTIARIYEKIALDPTYSSWVEHISYMGTFFPDNAYPTTDLTVNKRDSGTKKVYTDDVHPIAAGYAQMADTLFYNILYNYCQ
ncbi:SGNH/GDSL hydrolase family protein [Chryseobacterium sp. 2VB]|uniref:SGNH/GDSL hydrolase family protein n=1 Tax=Chryseobacterium sp. 2VB TaxID=2502204 RepID=UPI0010F5F56E|nr:SGNH/GDSL hydrolase family protein [Chryseobacterium sp. 2VB]